LGLSLAVLVQVGVGKLKQINRMCQSHSRAKNDFAIAEKVTLYGNNECRPDVVRYVNIVVHEMAYLLEPTHNTRFTTLVDSLIPEWRRRREMLNRLPVRHETWEY